MCVISWTLVSLGPFPASSDQHQGIEEGHHKDKQRMFRLIRNCKKKYCTHSNNRIKKRGNPAETEMTQLNSLCGDYRTKSR